MVDIRVLPLAQFRGIAQRGQNEATEISHSSSGIGDILALLHFEIVAVLVDRLSGLEFLPGRGVVELGPEIGVGEDGVGAFKGCYERVFVVQVGFDYFDAFRCPGLGLRGVAGYTPDFPAGLFGVQVCDGATLRS